MCNRFWNHLIKLFWQTGVLLLLVVGATAQNNTVLLSLQQAIDSTLQRNKDVQLAMLEQRIAHSKFKEMNAIFLPQVDFSFTALHSDNPLNVFGFKLQQQSVQATDFNPALLNNPKSIGDFTSKLQVKQPILNLDMIYLRKAVAKQADIYGYKTQRTKEYLIYEVQKAYLQLQLLYQQVVVLQEALATAQATALFVQNRVEAGLMQRADLMNTKVVITGIESSIAEANSNIANVSDFLSLLMDKPYGTLYKVQQTDIDIAANIDKAIPENRADFAAMQAAIDASDLAMDASRKSYLPKLNAFASYQYNDRSLFGFGSGSYLAGAMLSWDIFKGNSTKNKLATQQLERSRIAEQLDVQRKQSELELAKTIRQYNDAKFLIAQQEAAVATATEALRMLKDRHEQGLAGNTDLLMAQNQLAQQKLALANAIFQRNNTASYIQFLTANTQ